MSKLVILMYQSIYILYRLRIPFLPSILNIIFIRLLFSCQIGMGAKLGKGVVLGYGGLGIVIHKRVIIGKNVIITQGVTIGGTSKIHDVPQIGNNCLIAPGAKILGPVIVGNNSVVAANSVVLSNVPANSIVAGIPAKVIKENIKIEDYI